MSVPALYQRYTGAPSARTGLHHATIAPYGPYQAGTGTPVLVAVQNEGQWSRFCSIVLHRGDLVNDQRYATNQQRVQNRAVMDREIQRSLAAIDHADHIERLQDADLPHATVNDLAGPLEHPQLLEHSRWIGTETPTGPVVSVASPLDSLEGRRRVPALGADTHALSLELGLDA